MHSKKNTKFYLLILSLVLLACFILLSYLVHKGRFTKIDFDMTVKFQDHLSRKWDTPFSVISLLGTAEITTIIWLAVFIFLLIRRYFFTCLTMFLFFTTALVEVYGKLFVFHPGPPFMFYRGTINHLFPSSYIHTDFSYPSGHATRITFLAIFIVLYMYFRGQRIHKFLIQTGLLLFLVAVYVSRIYLGEHWFSDVVGGALLGASFGILSSLTLPVKEH